MLHYRRNTPTPGSGQARRRSTTSIPKANAPNAVAVTDGAIFAGAIVESNGSDFAFDATGTLVGEYVSRLEAMRTLPDADALGECDSIGRAAS